MSVNLVDNEHINVLVHALAEYARGREIVLRQSGDIVDLTSNRGLSRLGQIFRDENLRSYNARYDENVSSVYAYHDPKYLLRTPVEVLKALNGYIYQAFESENWNKSEIGGLCDFIRAKAIENLPGYQQAAWEITRNDKPINEE